MSQSKNAALFWPQDEEKSNTKTQNVYTQVEVDDHQ